MDIHGPRMTARIVRSRRFKIGWAAVMVGVLLLGLGAAYYIRSNLPVEMTRADVVGTWVEDGGPGVAVFREDGTAVFDRIPGGYPAPTGHGTWHLFEFDVPTVTVKVGSRGFDFTSAWSNFQTVLVTYTDDPDQPWSKHVFTRKAGPAK